MPGPYSLSSAGVWQVAHVPSAAGPATWFAPVVKFTSSWQEPQAAIEGRVYQLSPPAAFGSWHVVQKRMSCGYVMFGTTSGFFPMWRAWKKISPSYCTRGSPGSPVLLGGRLPIMLFGLWQRTQVLMSR